MLVLVAAACKRAEPVAPIVPPRDAAPRDATAADAGPPGATRPTRVELLHAVPATITVSSMVANPKIRPAQIADGDLATAWNSLTGELAGEWIEIELPWPAEIDELRLTVGFTAKGPHGEDWFAMNHRISHVTVYAGKDVLADTALDTTRRTLQSVKLAGGANAVRIHIDAVVPGTEPRWREVAISELEAWGTPPLDWVPPARPLAPTVVVADHAPTGSRFDRLCADVRGANSHWERDAKRYDDACDHEPTEAAITACKAEGPDRGRCELVDIPLPEDSTFGPAVFRCVSIPMSPVPYACEPWIAIGDRLVVMGEELGASTTDTDLLIAPTVARTTIGALRPKHDRELAVTYGTPPVTVACHDGMPACERVDPATIAWP